MISYVNILRSIAIIGVIIIHCSAPLLGFIENVQHWWIGNILDGLVRWCVPVFVMISGMLLLNTRKKESIKTFFKKRASKIILPFSAWVAFYSIWKLRDDLDNFESISMTEVVKNIISGNVYFHLWFLYMIVGLYLITPIIRVIIANSGRRLIEYYLIIWFLTSSLFPLVNYFFTVRVGVQLPYFTGYLGYFILGYYLHNTEITPKVRKIFYLLGMLGILITYIGTFVGTEAKGVFDGYFYGYHSPNTVLASIAVFVLIKSINWDRKFKKDGAFMKTIGGISTASFGIYLIHPFVMSLLISDTLSSLVGTKINYSFIHPIIGTPVTIIVVLSISFLAIWTMRKIPFVRNLVP